MVMDSPVRRTTPYSGTKLRVDEMRAVTFSRRDETRKVALSTTMRQSLATLPWCSGLTELVWEDDKFDHRDFPAGCFALV